MNPTSEIRRPNFLYIGASKSGSSWIYEILREHPEAFVPKVKDLHFFDDYYHKGLDWYLGFFRNSGPAKALGEIDHDYFLSEQTAARIRRDLPDVRLLCCLREPLDRTLSAFLFNRTTHIGERESFAEYAARPEVVRQNDYYGNLAPFYRLFPSDRILVLFYDELKDDPAGFARRIFEFLGVDPGFVPPSLNRVVLAARAPRFYVLSHLVFRITQMLRNAGLAGPVGRMKRSPFLDSLLFRPLREKPEVPKEISETLRAGYRKDYAGLSDLIGREIPRSWGAMQGTSAP